jgi:hypothetical protein
MHRPCPPRLQLGRESRRGRPELQPEGEPGERRLRQQKLLRTAELRSWRTSLSAGPMNTRDVH